MAARLFLLTEGARAAREGQRGEREESDRGEVGPAHEEEASRSAETAERGKRASYPFGGERGYRRRVPFGNRGAGLLLYAQVALAGALLGGLGCSSDPAMGSVGAVFGRDNDTHALYVRDVPEGLGAEEAGLLPGDEIVMIDGLYVRDLDRKEITRRLRGEVGTKVDLTVLRGSEVNRISVKRTALRSNDDVKPKEERVDP
jgi:hypothetical protein